MTSDTEIHMAITKTAKDLADNMDAEILRFFGSEEQLKAYAHLFVIETRPVRVTPYIDKPRGHNTVGYYIQTDMYIRPKTMEELEADKNV